MAEAESFKFKIPEAFTKYLKRDAPRDVKLMAAKGQVPMPPPVLAAALTFYLNDADAEVQKFARETLLGMPTGMVEKLVKDPIHPKTLDFFAREKLNQETILEAILLNKLTEDETYVFLGQQVPEKLATLVINNQVRLLRTPAIAEAIKKNKSALRSDVERMVSFLRMNGIILEGESPELTHQEIQDILNAPEPEEAAKLPEELIKEIDDSAPADEKKKLSMYQLIQTLNVSRKVKLALMGNKEARSILIKDSNKIVSTSVIKSPRITEQEVMSIAQMRSVSDEIIRTIAGNPEWARNYTLQAALANNPKTPFPIGLKIMRTLTMGDLEKLAKNKNVTGQLSKLAKALYSTKRK